MRIEGFKGVDAGPDRGSPADHVGYRQSRWECRNRQVSRALILFGGALALLLLQEDRGAGDVFGFFIAVVIGLGLGLLAVGLSLGTHEVTTRWVRMTGNPPWVGGKPWRRATAAFHAVYAEREGRGRGYSLTLVGHDEMVTVRVHVPHVARIIADGTGLSLVNQP